MPTDTLTITDDRTGRRYTLPIEEGAVRAGDLSKIRLSESDLGLVSYDPAFMNTASCRSNITFINGDEGTLRYRGYPIEELAEESTFLETAYLVVYGELPNKYQLDEWMHNVTTHTMLHENIKKFMEGFRYDAHPMGMLLSTVGALSTFYPDAKDVLDPDSRELQTYRAIAKMPTIAALAYRHRMGLPYIHPDNDLSYTENFLNMVFHPVGETRYQPNPAIVRAIDILFILQADHEQNCSTNVMRDIGSSHADPFTALSGACGALYGPLHGGANEAVIRMLQEIGSVENVPKAIETFKQGKARLMGFGHRVYKNYDPRAKIIKQIAEQVFDVTGKSPLLDIALELERIALEDDYFVQRRLHPNVDFYSGIIYQAIGFPTEMFAVLFAIARTVGWMAQWRELMEDPERRIARPKQIYKGEDVRYYTPMKTR